LGPEILVLEPNERPVARIYPGAGEHPYEWNEFRFLGPVNSRFDQHPPPRDHHDDHGILYGAFSLTTCLAEYFQDGRTIHRRAAPHYVVFDITRPLELLDLTGAWPTRAGGSMKLNSGRRDVSRAWSRRLYEAFADIDGLLYPSSMHANAPALALYERARDALPKAPVVNRPLDDPLFLGDIKRAARTIGYDIVPTF
jgi:RES domain-containing protein